MVRLRMVVSPPITLGFENVSVDRSPASLERLEANIPKPPG
jgi:hypothetical protein